MKKKIININKKVSKPLTSEQQQMVNQCVEMAMNLGRKYGPLGKKKGLAAEDLQQEACWGLCLAALDYKGRDLEAFKKYAAPYCHEAIMSAINRERELDECVDLFYGEYWLAETPDETEDERETRLEYQEQRYLKVEELLTVLNEKERKVISMVYGIKCQMRDFREVAQSLGLTQARVRDIYEKALTKMEFGEN